MLTGLKRILKNIILKDDDTNYEIKLKTREESNNGIRNVNEENHTNERDWFEFFKPLVMKKVMGVSTKYFNMVQKFWSQDYFQVADSLYIRD